MIEKENKQKQLERALKLTHVESFSYYKCDDERPMNSSDLAKEIIEWFLLGYGFILPHGAALKSYSSYHGISEAQEKDFRDMITKQIKDLIQHEPRLVKHDNDSYTMYYS